MTGGARPRTFGEGLAALGEGIAGRVMMNRIDKAERGTESAKPDRRRIVEALAGGSPAERLRQIERRSLR